MELPGSEYLFTLALLSLTYGGFAALFMLLRPDLTGKIREYDAFLIRGVIQKAFIVAACSMIPPLLGFWGLPPVTIWRVSSLIAGLLQLLFLVSWMGRRRKITGLPTSKWLVGNLLLQLLTAVFLLMAAAAIVFEPNVGSFLTGVTAILFLSGLAYQEAVIFLVHGVPAKRG